jgi:hypothetical protein
LVRSAAPITALTPTPEALVVDLGQSDWHGAGFATYLQQHDQLTLRNEMDAHPARFIRRLQQHRGAAKKDTDAHFTPFFDYDSLVMLRSR